MWTTGSAGVDSSVQFTRPRVKIERSMWDISGKIIRSPGVGLITTKGNEHGDREVEEENDIIQDVLASDERHGVSKVPVGM